MQHLAQELKAFKGSVKNGSLPGVSNLSLPEDNLSIWQFHVSPESFDQDLEATRQLKSDLRRIFGIHGHPAAIIMEARFPPDYPSSPVFLRVVSPRFRMYTGHVTAGGSICIEALTLSGSTNSWQPDHTLESVLATVLFNMMNCESVIVQTMTGPGGQSGPLAVDTRLGANVVLPYSLAEASAAFQRMVQNHGWKGSSGSGGGSGVGGMKRARAALHQPHQPGGYPAADRKAATASWMMAAAAVGQARVPVPPLPRRSSSPSRHGRHSSDGGGGSHALRQPKKQRQRQQQTVVIDLLSDDEVVEIRTKKKERKEHVILDATDAIKIFEGEPTARSRPEHAVDYSRGPPRRKPASPPPPPPHSLAERLAAANAQTGLHLLSPPNHWDHTDDALLGKPVFVELPLPPDHTNANFATAKTRQHSRGHTGQGDSVNSAYHDAAVGELMANGLSHEAATAALATAGGDLNQALMEMVMAQQGTVVSDEAVQELMANGISRRDAEAALEAKGGDPAEAILFFIDCAARGTTPAAAARAAGYSAKRKTAHTQLQQQREGESERERRQRQKQRDEEASARCKGARELEEVRAVLARFAAHQGVNAQRVIRVERVQNLDRWSEYLRCKTRIERAAAAAPAGANEQRLWHGAEKETISTICTEGFDIRVSNLSGALGAGIYFAQTSTYSDAYARAPKRAAIAPAPYVGMPPHHAALLAGVSAHHHSKVLARMGYALPPPHAAVAPPPQQHATPAFVDGGVAMLLCDVALGASTPGAPSMRRPPPGFHSASGGQIWAVYENSQAYPAYVVHYK